MPTKDELSNLLPFQDSQHSWTDDLPVCKQSGVGFSTNQIYREDGYRQEEHSFEDRSFHCRYDDSTFLYGVFDGHEGSKAANFTMQRMAAEILLGQLTGKSSYEEVKEVLSKDRPKYMKYGAAGSYIGHEMIHAFFENGLYRGSNGKDAQYHGLATRPEFASHAQCLIDQYGSYHVHNKGTKLDGRKTLTEDLADLGGIRLAYDAYERWAARKPEELKLQGLEKYSAKQMLSLSSAAITCEKN